MKTYKRLMVFVIIFALLFGFGSPSIASAAQIDAATAPKANKVVYYIPHPDDETLSIGTAIVNDINENYEVEVILLTDGSNTSVRNMLRLTKKELVAARMKEFYEALKILGVSPDKIFLRTVTDGALTIDHAKAVMREFGIDAINKTTSIYSENPDHKAAAAAMKELIRENVIKEGYSYIDVIDIDRYKGTFEPLTPEVIPLVRKALDVYCYNDQANGWYPIGYLSVGSWFYLANKNPRNKYYKL